ncbi:hypothetical protein WJX79_003144 [Trebouxia sp. C0005]
MASSSASGGELAELKEDLKGLKEQKAAELKKEKGARDHEILVELNKDLDRVQAAITALSSGGGQLIQQVHDEGITPIAQSIKSLSFKPLSMPLSMPLGMLGLPQLSCTKY